MEVEAAASPTYVSWAEVNVTTDRPRREVRYYLKRKDGALDLAVVGKEKSTKLMSYRLAIRGHAIFSNSPFMRFKARQEVVDWLDSVVSSPLPSAEPIMTKKVNKLGSWSLKEFQSSKMGHFSKEYMWLGSPWTCRKKRCHYQAFCRNGVKISVHDFVYVLAEANNRLVAYLEDMYEDSKSRKMVVVRWFHKIDEVGIALPRSYSDGEILFSLCRQDLRIECIDGLAAVLSPQHYEFYSKTATHTQLNPFVCQKQFKDNVVKPFDITQVKGYWKQGIMEWLFPSSCHANYEQPALELRVDASLSDHNLSRPRKRLCRFKGADVFLPEDDRKVFSDAVVADVPNFKKNPDDCKRSICLMNCMNGGSSTLSSLGNLKRDLCYLTVGSKVEVLSQDSGIRGCWFNALVIKRRKDKVKVQYQDIQDAEDESKKLEEWVSATRSANPDQYGIRLSGRKIIRPSRDHIEAPYVKVGSVVVEAPYVKVGSVVDVWRHDGWWEGIVVKKDSEDEYLIFFPGEKYEAVFGPGHVRESREWLGIEWKQIPERRDCVKSVLLDLKGQRGDRPRDLGLVEAPASNTVNDVRDPAVETNQPTDLNQMTDLAKDNSLLQLKWSSSKKRNSTKQLPHNNGSANNNRKVSESISGDRITVPKKLKVDRENCKHIGGSFLGSCVLTNLVMSS